MLENIKKAFVWFASSVDNHTSGASGRKLTVITFMALIIHGHLNYVDKANFYNVLIVYVVMILLLLSIVTVDQIIKFKSGLTTTTTTEKVEANISQTTVKETVKEDLKPS